MIMSAFCGGAASNLLLDDFFSGCLIALSLHWCGISIKYHGASSPSFRADLAKILSREK